VRCSRCVLPETYPGIVYDNQGVCNHCHTRRKKRPKGREALEAVVEEYRNKDPQAKYDCIVALSGGRDSSYLAYYVVKELGLKPLLYTFDNGVMPEQTWQNIHRIASILDVDRATTASDQVPRYAKHIMSCWMHRPSAAMVGLLCNGCRAGYMTGVTKVAAQTGIRLILTGSGEPALSFAQRLLSTDQSRRKRLPMLLGLAREWMHNPRYALNPPFVYVLGLEFYYRFRHKRTDRIASFPLFKYVEWDEDTIVSTIQNELGWRNTDYSQSTWKADCKISEFKDYLHMRMLGFTKNDEIVSSMIRAGDITREAAMQRLVSDNQTSQQFVAAMCKDLDLDYQQLEDALDAHGIQSRLQ
jgi:hypothetical protein